MAVFIYWMGLRWKGQRWRRGAFLDGVITYVLVVKFNVIRSQILIKIFVCFMCFR